MKYFAIALLLLLPGTIFAYETTITRIVDGDTVVANINGTSEKIRIIGINTPESVDPRRPVECFGKEASFQAEKLLLNKQVILENYSERDTHGRVLSYIQLPDGTDFGLEMIESGYAYSFKSYSHDRLAFYNTVEKDARANEVGLWSPDACLNESSNQDILKQERIDFITHILEIIEALIKFFL